MTNKELDEYIQKLEDRKRSQEKEMESLADKQERLIIETNLSKLVIMEKMKVLHQQIKMHLEDPTVEFSKIAPGVDLTLYGYQVEIKNKDREALKK